MHTDRGSDVRLVNRIEYGRLSGRVHGVDCLRMRGPQRLRFTLTHRCFEACAVSRSLDSDVNLLPSPKLFPPSPGRFLSRHQRPTAQFGYRYVFVFRKRKSDARKPDSGRAGSLATTIPSRAAPNVAPQGSHTSDIQGPQHPPIAISIGII
jgi:hypothetical protein